MTQDLPPIGELVPQAPPMCLLACVREAADDWIRCDVDPARSGPLAGADGRLGAHVAIEWLAQAVAAHAGLAARRTGNAPPVGFLLGTRRMTLRVDRLDPAARFVAVARHLRGHRGLVVYDCALESADGDRLVEGRINVYVADHLGDLLSETRP